MAMACGKERIRCSIARTIPHIFSERIHAHHVLFAERVKQAVQDQKDKLRHVSNKLATDEAHCVLSRRPDPHESGMVQDLLCWTPEQLEDPGLIEALNAFAYVAAVSLGERNGEQGEADDFKKDFKNEQIGLPWSCRTKGLPSISEVQVPVAMTSIRANVMRREVSREIGREAPATVGGNRWRHSRPERSR